MTQEEREAVERLSRWLDDFDRNNADDQTNDTFELGQDELIEVPAADLRTALSLISRLSEGWRPDREAVAEAIYQGAFADLWSRLPWSVIRNDAAKAPAYAATDLVLALPSSPPDDGWVLVPREPIYEQVRAMTESKATSDEGPFPPLCDLIDFSGENNTYIVLREAYRAAVRAVAPPALSEGEAS